jgi:uncharacterized protein (TIGR03435 family)
MRASFAITFFLCLIVYAQPRPAFEVASVREHNDSTPGPPIWTPLRSGERVILRKVRPDAVIDYAWHIDNLYQVAFPANMPLDWWDIEAKTDGIPDEAGLRLMFQSLLEDRFKVKTHFETREIAQYDLVVSKPGKLKNPDPDFLPKIDGIPMPLRPGSVNISMGNDGRHLQGRSASIEQLAETLGRQLRAPVRDRTSLTGNFDIDVPIENDPLDASSSAFLIEAVQRELGLKLERTKAPMKVLIVDHIEKPTPN